ncbi:cobyrinate a,c-diamide synthase [Rhodoblastus acidophilus]|uniref:Hydrogenobyrinate a,c-diamide synthase n=1 Tax=Rhodoblastus acidophilus TaxID=1074 RepID=A0A6N8DKK5_RHOAC|nr:cobyrinate a,c-diamide synthase [Rhodoblastus acidophilus]MCW2272864.1 cobyrinic acid a,c-diamide synthase [Rhodoblastus acidophilus]MTV29771.1 cobyrinate a,c-diamide synthase [Rhodoblastus acidophilus]
MSRLFVSAISKSCGKTTLSLGMAAAFVERGLRVQPFKKGPDYIDPMWHARAAGRTCYNLDFNTQTPDEIVSLCASASLDADLALVEGNKGLHDGVDTLGNDSSAALAKLLGAPVVLVVDTQGMARGVAPLLLGYQHFDSDVSIAGVILNKVGSARQESKLRHAIETYTNLKIVGVVGRDCDLSVDERHLGLTTPQEFFNAAPVIARARDAVRAGVDLDALLKAAEGSRPLWAAPRLRVHRAPDVTLAVARDAAFGFYYADDLDAFAQAGAKLIFFDALRDQSLPRCDGLFIGGGFPETQAAALSANTSLREDIRGGLAAGLPCYAECGGMMYLSRSITFAGETHQMVGALPADAVMGPRPQGKGLMRVEPTLEFPWPGNFPGQTVAAHEFHYARMENIDPGLRYAWKVRRGHGIDGFRDGMVVGNTLAGFAHLRDTSRLRWAESFVGFVRAQKQSALGAPALLRAAV